MNEKRILILGGAGFQVPFIRKAKEFGLFVGVVDINNNAPGKEYADVFYQESLKNHDSILKIANKFRPNGVTTGMVDVAVPACSYVTTNLGLPGMDIDTAKRVTNKFEMIKAFKKYNVPHPLFQYIPKNRVGIDNIELKCPLIIKPIDMAGSRGIFLVENEDELNASIKLCSEVGDSGDILIEEYMEGPEVSVELIVKNAKPHVVQITDKTTSGAPHFAETGHLQPSQLPSNICEQIKLVACQAAESLKIMNSLGHAEIKITKDGPKMVEIGARAGGDAIGEQLLELSKGISFPEIAIKIALGYDFEIPVERFSKSSCIRFLTTKDGVLTNVEGIEAAKLVSGIKTIDFTGIIGKRYAEMKDSSGRVGYILSQADDPIMAKKICDQAYEMIHVQFSNI